MRSLGASRSANACKNGFGRASLQRRNEVLLAACRKVWIERLEPRRLLAINAAINLGVLTVTSTAADQIDIHPTPGNPNTLEVVGNAGAQIFGPFDPSNYDAILVDAGGDNDIVTLATNAVTKAPCTMLGGDGDDQLFGDGNDVQVFVGGEGDDVMQGEGGADVYVFGPAAVDQDDFVNENPFKGDGVNVLTFSGLTGFEVPTAAADDVTIDLTGTVLGEPKFIAEHTNRTIRAGAVFSPEGVHVLIGGQGDDSIVGGTQSNTLVGQLGDDNLEGGPGDDHYVFTPAPVPLAAETDVIDEAPKEGIDLVNFGGLDLSGSFGGDDVFDFPGLPATEPATLDLSALPGQVGGHGVRDIFSGSPAEFEKINGGSGNDALTGNSKANTLTGNLGNDALSGKGGDDRLVGGFGNDQMTGGSGSNRWIFEPVGGADLETDIVGADDGTGTNTLDFEMVNDNVTVNLSNDTPNTLATHTNGAAQTRVVKTGAAGQAANLHNADMGPGNDNVTGNGTANVLKGNVGNDQLSGGAGDDMLDGFSGNDILTGGEGSDDLNGGDNNDTYRFGTAAANQTDTIREAADSPQKDTVDFSTLAANDPVTINLSLDNSLATHTNRTVNATAAARVAGVRIENAIGGAGNDTIVGNEVDNTINGGAGNDTITGGAGPDEIFGEGGNDSLSGEGAADKLDGGGDNDELFGGTGNDELTGAVGNDALAGNQDDDTYIFGTAVGTESDTAIEQVNEGSDTLNFASLAAGDNAEAYLRFNIFRPLTLARHSNRTLGIGLLENNRFENAIGGAGNDTLWARSDTGNCSLQGNGGNDTYFFGSVASPSLLVTLVEPANQGIDTLDFEAFSSPVMVDLTKGEPATGGDTASSGFLAVKMAGNGQAANLERVLGGSGNDVLIGNAAANHLQGNDGNDQLTGGLGNDALLGGANDDIYSFASLTLPAIPETDQITETAGAGTDKLNFTSLAATDGAVVNLTSDAALGSHAARMITGAAGTAANTENATGGAGNDNITGNASPNLLEGGPGNDTLAGQAASDTYLYSGAGPFGSDTINEVSGCIDLDVVKFVNTAAVTIDIGEAAQQNVIGGGGATLKLKLSSATSIEMVDGAPAGSIVIGNGCGVIGTPPFNQAGPVAISGGQVEGIPNLPVAGAVHALATRTYNDAGTNRVRAYIGAVNGGVWRTNDALAANPVWTSVTTDLPLSIGEIDLDPADPTGNTVVAGTGRWGGPAFRGGRLVGVMKTTDGVNWNLLPSMGLANRSISGVAIRGNNILVSATTTFVGGTAAGGIFLSTDGGMTFNAVGGAALNNADVNDLAGDPLDPSRFYIAVARRTLALGGGIYQSNDGGSTWMPINNGIPGGVMGATTNNFELAVHHRINGATETNAIYAGIVNNSMLTNVFRRDMTVGAPAWASVGMPQTQAMAGITNVTLQPPPGNATFPTGTVFITSAAHTVQNGDVVTIAGVIGMAGVNGTWSAIPLTDPNRFALNPAQTLGAGVYGGGGTWTGPTTGIHPGSQGGRHFSIVADPLDANVVYVGGDRQPTPWENGANNYSGRLFRGNAGVWTSITHMNAAGTSSPHADSHDMVAIVDPANAARTILLEADDGGMYVRTNATSNAGGWSSANGNLAITEFYSTEYDTLNNRLIGGTQDLGTIEQTNAVGAGGQGQWNTGADVPPAPNFQQGDGTDVVVDDSGAASSIRYSAPPQFTTLRRRTFDNAGTVTNNAGPFFPVDGGGNPLFTVDSFPFVPNFELSNTANMQLVVGSIRRVWESMNQGTAWAQVNLPANQQVDALAYGGRRNGATDNTLLYIGTALGNIFRRDAAGGAGLTAVPPGVAVPIRDIAIDPDNWQFAYAITANQVFRTINGGANWANITGNLGTRTPGGVIDLRSLALVAKAGSLARTLIVGGLGGIFGLTTNGQPAASTPWRKIGTQFPAELLVSDVRYDPVDDLLSIGTYGRGAYTLSNFHADTVLPTVAAVLFNNAAAGAAGWSNNFRTLVPPVPFPNNVPIGLTDLGIFAQAGTGNLQLRPYTQSNITQIKAIFSRDVYVEQEDLKLQLNDGTMVNFAGFAYDVATATATWTLDGPILNNRLTMTLNADGPSAIRAAARPPLLPTLGDFAILDGDWINPVARDENPSSRFPSGNGDVGGDFVFKFSFLAGDVNGNEAVTVADVNYVRARVGAAAGAANYDFRGDLNGDGMIDNTDVGLARDRVGQLLPNVPGPKDAIAAKLEEGTTDAVSRARPASFGGLFADRRTIASLVLDDNDSAVEV